MGESAAKLLFLAMLGVYSCGQAIYMTPTIQDTFTGFVSPYFGIPQVAPPAGSPLSAYGHYELLRPAFFVTFSIIPLLASLVVFEFIRDYNVHRNTSKHVLRVSAALRRVPPSCMGWQWHYGFCYGELVFLAALFGGNTAILVYSWINQRKFLPRPGEDYTFNTVLELAGVAFGYNSVFNFAFLFLPCTRHCAWMEFFNISYANGVKYHRWLGVASLVTAVLHAVPFYWLWKRQGVLAEKALPCFDCQTDYYHIGYPKWFNVFGEISLFFMIVLSIASIPWVRRTFFETFYYVHHLYIPTVVFAVLHWSDIIWWLLPTLILYLTSRALSRWNTLFPVVVREFRALPDGIVKVVLSRSTQHNGNFDVGQFVYLNVPAISKLQWHAFTISSSPRTSADTLTILLKSLGDWTQDLVEHAQKCEEMSTQPVVYMDGYYGASLEEYHEYPTVCLIGGGIGATPLFAILEDMVARLSGPQILPKQRVFFIFTFRELALLEEICPVVATIRELDPHGRLFSFRFFMTRAPSASALNDSIDYERLIAGSAANTGSRNSGTISSSDSIRSSSINKGDDIDSLSSARTSSCPFASSAIFWRWTPTPTPFVEPARSKGYKTFIYVGTIVCTVIIVMWLEFGGGVLMAHGAQTQYWPLQNFVEITVLFAIPVIVYATLLGERLLDWRNGSKRAISSDCASLLSNNNDQARYGALSTMSTSWITGGLAADIVTFGDLLADLDVEIGKRPDMNQLLREVYTAHRGSLKDSISESANLTMGQTVGVFISGPEALKRSTEAAIATLGPLDFDIHEEEFEL